MNEEQARDYLIMVGLSALTDFQHWDKVTPQFSKSTLKKISKWAYPVTFYGYGPDKEKVKDAVKTFLGSLA